MNVCIHTGHIREHADRYLPGAGAAPMLFLTLHVWDEYLRADVPHKMRIERQDLVAKFEPLLTPGRQMTVRSRSKLIPIIRHGVVQREVMGFEILAIEFHSRGQATESTDTQATPAAASSSSDESPLARAMRELETPQA